MAVRLVGDCLGNLCDGLPHTIPGDSDRCTEARDLRIVVHRSEMDKRFRTGDAVSFETAATLEIDDTIGQFLQWLFSVALKNTLELLTKEWNRLINNA